MADVVLFAFWGAVFGADVSRNDSAWNTLFSHEKMKVAIFGKRIIWNNTRMGVVEILGVGVAIVHIAFGVVLPLLKGFRLPENFPDYIGLRFLQNTKTFLNLKVVSTLH